MRIRRQTMKIIVSMDTRGEIWAWGYPLLMDAYPAARLEAVHRIEPQELRSCSLNADPVAACTGFDRDEGRTRPACRGAALHEHA